MAIRTENAAGRLHSILAKMRTARQGNAWEILAGLFGLQKDDAVSIVERLIQLRQVCDQAEKAALNIQGISEDLRMRAFPQIRDAIRTMILSLNGSWDNCHRALNQIDYTALELCSELLSQFSSEKEIEKSTLDDLQRSLDELLAQVTESSIDGELKTLITDHLQAIRKAIIDYSVTGVSGIRAAQESAVGMVVINHISFQEAKSGEASTIDALIKFLEVLDKAISVGRDLLPLAPLLLGTGLS
jgi:hypothetical protein